MNTTVGRVSVKIALIISVGAIMLAVLAYYILFPPNTSISVYRPGGGTITFSRTGVSLEPPADYYATNGFDRIESYVSRLLVPSTRFKHVSIFTPDGKRGVGLQAWDGKIEAGLTVDWRQDAEKEATIRSFFERLGIAPTRDWLAGDGGVPDATRCLTYPITGNADEVTAITKRILHELYGVSPTEALDIDYSGK